MIFNFLNITPSAIVDIVALAILLLFSILGAVKGFVKTFISTFGGIISLIIAISLSSLTVSFFESKFSLVTSISNGLNGLLSNLFGENVMNMTIGNASSEALSGNLSAWLVTIILNVKSGGTVDPNATLNTIITPVFGYYVVSAISILLLFVLIKIAFYIVGSLFGKIRKLKLVKGLDAGLGVALGLIRGANLIVIIVFIIGIIPVSFMQQLSNAIGQSSVVSFLNGINLFSIVFNLISSPTQVVSFIKGLIS